MVALQTEEITGLKQALDDEYKSWTTYDQVIKDFGEVRPFINIRDAEARHIQALLNLFEHYGISPILNRWIGITPKFISLKEACKASVKEEIENVALYDRLLSATSKQNILTVYNTLRTASQERHLPAFERCAERQH